MNDQICDISVSPGELAAASINQPVELDEILSLLGALVAREYFHTAKGILEHIQILS